MEDADSLSDSGSENFGDEMSDISGDVVMSHTSKPSWATLLPAQLMMGRSGPDSLAPDAPSVRDILSVYGHTQVLNNTLHSADGPLLRLLQIHPDAFGGPLRTNLILRPVFDAPAYIALSYSWGDATEFKSISIGSAETPFPVTINLWNALQHLRHADEVVNVWVDAICINQSNVLDKASQVQIMAQVYSEAREVRIWLGDILPMQDPLSRDDAERFYLLCCQHQPWWKRLWIIQECTYARKCPVVFVGDSLVTLQDFVQRWTSAAESCDSLSQRKVLEEHLAFLCMPYNAWKEQTARLNHRLPLIQRLRQIVGRQCTDFRDRIYALLSIIRESEAEQILPDYQKSYAALRAEVEELLERSGDWDGAVINSALPDFSTEIVDAMNRGERGYVRDLLRANAVPENELRHALRVTSARADHESVSLLLDALVDTKDWRRETGDRHGSTLQATLMGHHPELMELLLDAGADVKGMKGHALYEAAATGNSEVVKRLLIAIANISHRQRAIPHVTEDETTIAFYAAAAGGHVEVIKLLLIAGVDLKAKGADALFAASGGGHLETVELLLIAGVDILSNERWQARTEGTALYAASSGNHVEVARLLLDMGADVDAQGGKYDSALQAALAEGHSDVANLLLDRGADIDGRGGYYNNALQAAAAKGSQQVTRLLEAGAYADTQGGHYGNALQAASAGGYQHTVKQLLEAGANVNAQGGEYGSALQAAAYGGHKGVVKLLLDAGADLRAQEGHCGDAYLAATRGGHQEVVQLLVDAWPDGDDRIPEDFLDSALLAASGGGHQGIEQLLRSVSA